MLTLRKSKQELIQQSFCDMFGKEGK